MSYGYSSRYDTPREDPVSVDLSARTIEITLPAARGEPPWNARFTLHGAKRCKSCQHPVTLYVAGEAPAEMYRHAHLISQPWEHGFWRVLPHASGFVLTAGNHPYTVSCHGHVSGSCDETDREVAFLAELPASQPLVPAQPARLPAHLRPATAPQPLPAEPVPELEPDRQESPAVRPAPSQLSLF